MIFSCFEAEGVGARIDVPLDVPENGRYEILARIAQGPDYGEYFALLDGKPMNLDNRVAATSEVPTTGPEVFHDYLPEIYIAIDRPLGWLKLEKGRHTLSFVCIGRDGRSAGYNLGINDVVMERVPEIANSNMAKPLGRGSGIVYRGVSLSTYRDQLKTATGVEKAAALRSIGSFGGDAAGAVGDLAAALKDADPTVRMAAEWALSQVGPAGMSGVVGLIDALGDGDGRVRCLAAVALREMGPSGAAAVPALAKALRDPDPYVRSPAAEALGRMGPAGKDGVPALIEAMNVPGEQTYVLRSAASALGHIGPSAESAIPTLERMIKMQRVAYLAQAAILEIQGKKPPVW